MPKQNRNPVIRRMQTEYQLRDIEPKSGGKSLLHDKNGMPRVNKASSGGRKMPPPAPIKNDPIRVPGIENTNQAPIPASQISIPKRQLNSDRGLQELPARPPKQPMATVGMHDEQMWFDEELVAGGTRPRGTEVIDNNEEVDVESLQGIPDGWGGMKSGSVGDILPEDLEEAENSPTRDAEAPNTPTEPEPEDVPLETLGFYLARGYYAILLKGQLLIKYDDMSYVRNVVEDMILRHDISVEDIQVVKSVPIDFGVVFKDE